MKEAIELLNAPTPRPDQLPERIEQLNICAFDVAEAIRDLQDDAGRHEEEATTEAASESNDAKRKARRTEILRDNTEYHALQIVIRQEQRILVRVQERSHRLARELRLHIAHTTAQSF